MSFLILHQLMGAMVSTNMNVSLLAKVGLIWHLLPFHQTRANQPFGSTEKKDGNFARIQKEVAQLTLGDTSCT